MCLFANKCGVFTLRAYLQPEPFHVDCASIHEPHGTKAEEEENTDMETSTHKLNFTPLLSLAALPGVLCSPEKEPRAFRGLYALAVIACPTLLLEMAEKFCFVSVSHIWKPVVSYSSFSHVASSLPV